MVLLAWLRERRRKRHGDSSCGGAHPFSPLVDFYVARYK